MVGGNPETMKEIYIYIEISLTGSGFTINSSTCQDKISRDGCGSDVDDVVIYKI